MFGANYLQNTDIKTTFKFLVYLFDLALFLRDHSCACDWLVLRFLRLFEWMLCCYSHYSRVSDQMILQFQHYQSAKEEIGSGFTYLKIQGKRTLYDVLLAFLWLSTNLACLSILKCQSLYRRFVSCQSMYWYGTCKQKWKKLSKLLFLVTRQLFLVALTNH